MIFSRPWSIPAIRDSAARTRAPSRYNVFEYGYPDPNADLSTPDSPASTRRQEASPPTPPFEPGAVYSTAAWRATTIDDAAAREKLFLSINVVGKVRDHLTACTVLYHIAIPPRPLRHKTRHALFPLQGPNPRGNSLDFLRRRYS